MRDSVKTDEDPDFEGRHRWSVGADLKCNGEGAVIVFRRVAENEGRRVLTGPGKNVVWRSRS